MSAIKSYTDLEQSKKLTEILPLESADMRIGNYVGKSGKVDGTNVHYYPKNESFGAPEIIYAWSLAALLSVIPEPDLVQNSEGTWLIHSWVNAYPWSVGGYSNPVDACVAMVEHLHELKML